jgi:hypothetical protein
LRRAALSAGICGKLFIFCPGHNLVTAFSLGLEHSFVGGGKEITSALSMLREAG